MRAALRRARGNPLHRADVTGGAQGPRDTALIFAGVGQPMAEFIAGLAAAGRRVGVGPPLVPGGRSRGSVLLR